MNPLTKILKLLMMTIFIVTSNRIYAQSYHTSSQKAIKYFQKAVESFHEDNDVALENVDKALKYDEKFTDAILLKAELCSEIEDDTTAMLLYERLFEIDSFAFPKSSISLAKLYMKYQQFDKSEQLLQWYLSLKNQKDNHREMAKHCLLLTNFRKSSMENPVDYNPKNIGNAINTSADEYVNQFYVNDDKLIYTKRYKSESQKDLLLEENVFVSTNYDSIWSIPSLLIGNFKDIGAANISAAGDEIFFSAKEWNDGLGSCDIYYVIFENGKWSYPKNLKSINTSEWESQPCISRDGKELYFVRRSRKLGTSDIYVSKRSVGGNWMTPTKLNSNINTDANEMAPFLHHDGKTLYFSSEGHLGMGGFDLFMSQRDEKGEWTKAVNIGYPLNTSENEINLVISNDAKKAFISSDKGDGYGNYDIYEFELDEKFRPKAVEIRISSDEEYYATTLKRQASVVLKNIYFNFDSAELTPDSDEGINALYNFLISNPEMEILLEGHTDDIGSEDYNLQLSERRAESVKMALVDRGILHSRIKTKGCGSSQPLFPTNLDDELKIFNRRVSMSISTK